MEIRPVDSRDLEALLALWAQVFPEYADPARPHRDPRANIERKLAFGDGLFWLAERDGNVVGSLMAGYDGHRGWIYSVAIQPELRRSGIGRALVRHAEANLRAKGCPKVNLQVLAHSAEAQGFWRAAGYVQDEALSFGKRLA